MARTEQTTLARPAAIAETRESAKKPFSWAPLGVYAGLIFGAVIVLYPFFYLLMNSVKPGPEILNSPNSLPSEITFSGYTGAFERLNMLELFRNSILLAGSITIINTLLSALAAYAIAKIPFPGANKLFGFMLVTMMIPGILFLIPTYVMMYRLGWVPSFQALIVPSAVTVYNIFLLRQFITGIPSELIEAFRLDGASEPQIFIRLILPVSRPSLAAVAILNFMGSWNDFMGPLLYLNRPNLWTVQLGLYQFQSSVPGQYEQEKWAAMALVTIPLVIVYFFLQDQFVKAFANTSLK
jgi:multiple sugar transport system permease protein